MTNGYRIKEYVFPQVSVADSDYSAAGSKLTKHSSHIINGEVLRIQCLSNFAGSLIVSQSGTQVANVWTNLTIASGTGKLDSLSFTNNTGSYVINDVVKLVISGTASGTDVNIGPVSIFYR
mgnify:FL=1